MTRFQRALGVFAVAAIGLWGCSQGPNASSSSERIKSLEAKSARLEEDYKTAAAARDQFRRKLSANDEALAQLQRDLDSLRAAAREREEALKARTAERDQLQVQYDGFRKNLRELLGQAEASLKGGTPDLAATPTRETLALPAIVGTTSGPVLPSQN
jgi:septal ring factor EnvC (AmiA/AmiB activator)